MKSLLTILLICFCFVGYGQTVTIDSLGHKTTYSADSVYGTIRWRGILPLTTPTPKYDTVKVIMLVCDTSDSHIPFYDGGLKHPSMTISLADPHVYWQFGYWVKETNLFYSTSSKYGFYLGENKKPLSKNILIWNFNLLNTNK